MVTEASGPFEELRAKLAAESIKIDADWDITAYIARTDLSFTDHDGHRFVVYVLASDD